MLKLSKKIKNNLISKTEENLSLQEGVKKLYLIIVMIY